MAKQVMERKAADNKYLHKDFHNGLNCAIDYLNNNFGSQAVKEYLQRFTRTYYAPLIVDLKERGLVALKEHFQKIYEIEGGDVDFTINENEFTIKVNSCPAVSHIRKSGMSVSPLFVETTRTVNETLCENTPFSAELINYDPETGSNVQRFYRRDI